MNVRISSVVVGVAVGCFLLLAVISHPVAAQDPLQKMQQALRTAASSNATSPEYRSKLDALDKQVDQLRKALGEFPDLPESYQENLASISSYVSSLEFSKATDEISTVLDEVRDDFNVKLRYMESGYFSIDFAKTDKPIIASAFQSRTGTVVALSADNQLRAWQAKDARRIWEFKPEGKRISAFAIHPTKEVTMVGFANGAAELLNANGKPVRDYRISDNSAINSIVFISDKDEAAFGLRNGEVTFWDLEAGQQKWTRQNRRNRPVQVMADPRRGAVFSSYADGSVRALSMESGKMLYELGGEKRVPLAGMKVVNNIEGIPELLMVRRNGELNWHDFQTGKLLRNTKKPDMIHTIDYSPETGLLLAAGRSKSGGHIIVHDSRKSEMFKIPVIPRSATFLNETTLLVGDARGGLTKMDLAMAKSKPTSEATVEVKTMYKNKEKTGYFVWYVAKALLKSDKHFKRFGLPSRTKKGFPPGRFYIWAGTKKPNRGKVLVELRNSSFEPLIVEVPPDVE